MLKLGPFRIGFPPPLPKPRATPRAPAPPSAVDSFQAPDAAFDGALVGANGKVFPPGTPLELVPAVEPGPCTPADETILFVNGGRTNRDDQVLNLQNIASALGARAIGIHNATVGLPQDLAQCLLDRLGVGENPAVSTLATTLGAELARGRPVHILCHSQGAAITCRALEQVAASLKAQGLSQPEVEQRLAAIKVETFGGASDHFPDGPRYVHYVNDADPVCALAGVTSPTAHHIGKGAEVRRFFDPGAPGPMGAHHFDDVYLRHRTAER
jgi:hypothetical protein